MIFFIFRLAMLALLAYGVWRLTLLLRANRGAQAALPTTRVADELEKLARLRDQGILTTAEFEARKKIVLGR